MVPPCPLISEVPQYTSPRLGLISLLEISQKAVCYFLVDCDFPCILRLGELHCSVALRDRTLGDVTLNREPRVFHTVARQQTTHSPRGDPP